MFVAYFYVTGTIASVVKNVTRLTNVSTIFYVTSVVADVIENVFSLANVVAVLYVTVDVTTAVKYVITIPNSNENEISVNGIVDEVPRSAVKESPIKEYVAVLRGSFGCFDKVTFADDDGLYHISAGGVELYCQSILSFAACRKSKYRQSNTQCKYCDFGGESNIFHTSS